MSNIGVKGEQSTSAEIALLTALAALGISSSTQAIQKTGSGSFANVSVPAIAPTVSYSVVSTSSDYIATQTGGIIIILVNATLGNRTVTLPTAVGNTSRFSVKKTDSSANTVTVVPATPQTIDGGTTAVIRTQYADIDVITDGANWFVV